MRYGLCVSLLLVLVSAKSADAEVPRVVTDMPVTHALVSEVLGDLGEPVLLLETGADPHNFQLRPSQAGAIAAANLVVWIGPELTPWLERSLSAAPDVPALSLLRTKGVALRRFDEIGPDGPEGDAAELPQPISAPHENGQNHEGIDPHAWLDPDNAALWIGTIADALAEMDPEHAATYRANASLAQARIAALDENLDAALANARARPFIVTHDALGYFAAHYGLTIAASISSGNAATPGAAHLTELRDLLEGGGILCIFPETGQDPKQLSILAEGTPAKIGPALDPEGRSIAPGSKLYLGLMQGLATALVDCISGGQ
ncbi:MAG: zinc ABC transporter substrate-binding protein [Paracoccaceae bacterium]